MAIAVHIATSHSGIARFSERERSPDTDGELDQLLSSLPAARPRARRTVQSTPLTQLGPDPPAAFNPSSTSSTPYFASANRYC